MPTLEGIDRLVRIDPDEGSVHVELVRAGPFETDDRIERWRRPTRCRWLGITLFLATRPLISMRGGDQSVAQVHARLCRLVCSGVKDADVDIKARGNFRRVR